MKCPNPRVLAFLFLAGIFILSCNKDDDDDNAPKNNVSFDGETYELSSGFLEFYGQNDDNSADFDVILASSEIVYDETEDEFTGTGEAVYLDLNSPSLTELAAGTYSYDGLYYSDPEAIRQPNTFVDAGLFLNYNVATENGAIYYSDENSTGTVVVAKSGSTYTITFNFTVDEGKEVRGKFEGPLQLPPDSKKSSEDAGKSMTGKQK